MRATNMEKSVRTEWPTCEVCGKAVTATQTAFLSISWETISAILREQREYVAREMEAELVSGRETPQQWVWGHDGCLPGNDYFIATWRIDTVQKALAWTLHLLGKRWFPDTDWERAIRRLGFASKVGDD